jgi:hypothetical protein
VVVVVGWVVVVVVVVVVVGRVVVVVVVGRVVVVVVVAVVVGRVVVVVVGDGVLPPQVTPLTAKDVGAAFTVLFHEAMNPGDTVEPVLTAPFHAALLAVTVVPDWAQVAFQPWLTVWPFAKVNVKVQLLHGSPVLVTSSPPWKPSGHWPRTEYFTAHEVAACAGGATAARGARASTATSRGTARRVIGVPRSHQGWCRGWTRGPTIGLTAG